MLPNGEQVVADAGWRQAAEHSRRSRCQERIRIEQRPPLDREGKKDQAKAHAKLIRKERRGERRSRGAAAADKPPPARTGRKPAGKPASPAKPAPRKPAGPGKGAR